METFGEEISAEACSGKEIAGLLRKIMIIRASVDALCRDGTSEISRDPRTKRL